MKTFQFTPNEIRVLLIALSNMEEDGKKFLGKSVRMNAILQPDLNVISELQDLLSK